MPVWLCLISNIWNEPARQAQGWFTFSLHGILLSTYIPSHGVIIGLDYRFGRCFLAAERSISFNNLWKVRW